MDHPESPASAGLSARRGRVLAAEWERHDLCVMGWVGNDPVSTRFVTAMKTDYALVARAIVEFEPVLMVAAPGFAREAEAYCGPAVDVVELPLHVPWVRDAAPLFARDGAGLVAVEFEFNRWGSLASPNDGVEAGAELARRLGVEHVRVPFVLEGGSISTDGEGTLLVAEPTVLTQDRNPGATRADAEAVFGEALGIEKVIWLEHGLLEDRTGGHVDNVAAFVAPGRVLCQTVAVREDPNFARLAANREALAAATDARGRRLDVVELELLPYRAWAGRRIALPYLNHFVGNGVVVVPLALAPSDHEALRRVREVFPDREVVGVPATNLARGGGGPHCITRHVPAS
jgi:agmatine deiminase